MTVPASIPPVQLFYSRTSRLAITSLVLGCCMILFSIFTGLPALGFGIAALVAIKRSHGGLEGRGLAIAGICLGVASMGCLPLMMWGMKFPVNNAANKSKAGAAIQSLCTASKAYHDEYGKWPEPHGAADLVLIFNGGRDPVTGEYVSRVADQNPRKIRFMEFTVKDVTLPGAGGRSPLAFYDPWGTPYAFCFDNDKLGVYFRGPGTTGETVWLDSPAGDNKVCMPFMDFSGAMTIPAGYAFFSNGPDGRTGTGPTTRDDIRSWK